MTYRAEWHGTVLAESDDIVEVEGNPYFPISSVRADLISPSDMSSVCPWKGTASYYSVVVDGETNPDAVWYYPTPKPEAEMVRDRVAFWRGVEITQV